MDKLLSFLVIEIKRPEYEGLEPANIRSEIQEIVDILYADWVVQSQKNSGESNLTYAYRAYNIREHGLATGECQAHFQQFMDLLRRFQSIMVDFKMLARDKALDNDLQRSTRDRLAKVITAMSLALALVVNNNRMTMLKDRNTDTPALPPGVSATETVGDFTNDAQDGNKSIHKILYHCLNKLSDLRARRHAGYVMVPHITRDGYNSSAYKRYCTIDQFPDWAINQTADRELWNIMVESERTKTWLVKILNSMLLSEFPDLNADRHVFAFENGIYDAMADHFDPYTESHLVSRPVHDDADDDDDPDIADPYAAESLVGDPIATESGRSTPNVPDDIQAMLAEFEGAATATFPAFSDAAEVRVDINATSGSSSYAFDNESPGSANAYSVMQKEDGIIHGRVACKYFEGKQFDPNTASKDPAGWRDIDTEDLDRVLKEQKLFDADRPDSYEWKHGKVYEVILAMMGRMVFSVGELDDWQVALFFKGVAGSGKSTILKVVKSFYRTEDVAIMSNNIEQKFGLHPLAEKYITLCYEMRSNFGLDQAELQCIISGEELTLAVKNKLANVAHTWTSPFAAAGNMLASWEDSQGSIARRFLLTEFMHQVKDSDPQLFSRMEKNIANILLKCVRAYREMSAKYKRANLWNKKGGVQPLPEYFHRTRAALSRTTNSLVSFLESSGEVQVQQGARMQWTAFKDLYKRFCNSSGVKPQALSSTDSYMSIFEQQGLSVTERAVEMKDLETGNMATCVWVLNVAPTMTGQPQQQQQQSHQQSQGRFQNGRNHHNNHHNNHRGNGGNNDDDGNNDGGNNDGGNNDGDGNEPETTVETQSTDPVNLINPINPINAAKTTTTGIKTVRPPNSSNATQESATIPGQKKRKNNDPPPDPPAPKRNKN